MSSRQIPNSFFSSVTTRTRNTIIQLRKGFRQPVVRTLSPKEKNTNAFVLGRLEQKTADDRFSRKYAVSTKCALYVTARRSLRARMAIVCIE